jgi:hypothetical protein
MRETQNIQASLAFNQSTASSKLKIAVSMCEPAIQQKPNARINRAAIA